MLLLFFLLFVQLFSLELHKVFDRGEMDAAAVINLSELWQGSSSVSDYTIKFHSYPGNLLRVERTGTVRSLSWALRKGER